MKIVFDVEPFGYGPMASTLPIVKNLHDVIGDSCEFALLSSGSQLKLAKLSGVPFDGLYDMNIMDFYAEFGYSENDLYISNLHYHSMKKVVSLPVKKVYIDPLFWMWDRLQIQPNEVDLYIVQNFFGLEQQCNRLKVSCPHVVNPIVSYTKSDFLDQKKDLDCFISLGGIDNAYFDVNIGFFIKLIECLIQTRFLSGKSFVVACGSNTICALKEAFSGYSNIVFTTLGEKDFCRMIVRSKYFISNAGILTYYDALALGVNPFFILPHNYSSYQQFELIKSCTRSFGGIQHYEVFENEKIPAYLEEGEGIERVSGGMSDFIKKESYRDVIELLDKKLRVHNFAYKGLFPCNGAEQAADLIKRLI